MSIRCTICFYPDPPAINPALALPACREEGHGLPAERKWGLSLIFWQENRGSPHFLVLFFQVFGEATASPRLLSPLPHAVHPAVLRVQKRSTSEAEAKQKRCCTASAPVHIRSTCEARAKSSEINRNLCEAQRCTPRLSRRMFRMFRMFRMCLMCRTCLACRAGPPPRPIWRGPPHPGENRPSIHVGLGYLSDGNLA